jgi:hypothetical protein
VAIVLQLKKLSWIYSIAVAAEWILAGWLLSEYQAAWWVWVGSCVVCLHLAWVGFDAVAVGIVWIVCLVWIGAFVGSWFKSFPWAGIAAWAGGLAASWIFGLILILTLAQARRMLLSDRWSRTQVFWLLAIASCLGLWLGWLVTQNFLLTSPGKIG